MEADMKRRLRYRGTAGAYFVLGIVIIVVGILIGFGIMIFGIGSLVVNRDILSLFLQNSGLITSFLTFNNVMIMLFIACAVIGLAIIIGSVLMGLVFIGMRTIIRAQDQTLARVDILMEGMHPREMSAGPEPVAASMPEPVPEPAPAPAPEAPPNVSAVASPENLGF